MSQKQLITAMVTLIGLSHTLAGVWFEPFAKKEQLPIKLKYYANGWQWMKYAPLSDDAEVFKK